MTAVDVRALQLNVWNDVCISARVLSSFLSFWQARSRRPAVPSSVPSSRVGAPPPVVGVLRRGALAGAD